MEESYEDYDERQEPRASEDAITVSETTLKWSAREMFDAIVRAAAESIVEGTSRDLRAAVTKSVQQQIDAQVGAVVSGVLEGTIQPTNEWGEAKGEAMSLRELVGKTAREYLGTKVNKDGVPGSYHADTPRLNYLVQQVVAKEFDYRMQTEVKKAVELARAEAVAKVGAVVGDLILKLK